MFKQQPTHDISMLSNIDTNLHIDREVSQLHRAVGQLTKKIRRLDDQLIEIKNYTSKKSSKQQATGDFSRYQQILLALEKKLQLVVQKVNEQLKIFTRKFQEKYASAVQTNIKLKQQLQKLERAAKAQTNELRKKYQEEYKNIREQAKEIEKHWHSSLRALEEKVEDAKDNKKQKILQQKIIKLQSELAKNQQQNKHLQAELKKKIKQAGIAQQTLLKEKSLKESLEQELTQIKTKNSILQTNFRQFQSEENEKQAHLKKMLKQQTHLQKEIKNLKITNQHLQDQLEVQRKTNSIMSQNSPRISQNPSFASLKDHSDYFDRNSHQSYNNTNQSFEKILINLNDQQVEPFKSLQFKYEKASINSQQYINAFKAENKNSIKSNTSQSFFQNLQKQSVKKEKKIEVNKLSDTNKGPQYESMMSSGTGKIWQQFHDSEDDETQDYFVRR